MVNISYIGKELEIFANAKKWKNYYGSFIKPFLRGRVLEVGAGIGTTTSALFDAQVSEWICLEPDEAFVKTLAQKIRDNELPSICREKLGTVQQLDSNDLYDCILYIDVLEHIENDALELQAAVNHLKPNGRVIILSPAHQWLFAPFDKEIGHFRRYTKSSLTQISPKKSTIEKLIYLDSVGMLLSIGNKLVLQQSMPTLKQILFWDGYIIPLSKIFDFVIRYMIGKSVMGIWKNET